MRPELYRPLARRKGLLQTRVGDELVVVDTTRNRGMALSGTLARLFHLCNGEETVAGISDRLAAELVTSSEPELIWAGLRRLKKADLLEEEEIPFPKNLRLHSRRQALKAIGLGAGAVAIVLLPVPADAASCLPNASLCTTDAQCCSGRCCHSNGHCGTGGPGC